MLVSALEQLTADAPTWLAKVYISRCFTKVFTLCDDPLHQVCFIGGLHIGVYINNVEPLLLQRIFVLNIKQGNS